MIRHSTRLIIIATMIFCCLLSCTRKTNEELNYFNYNQIGGLETLDPAFAKNLAIMWGVNFLYNTLVEIDSNMKVQPSIASAWHSSDDGTEYTFHIRNDIYFHDHKIFPNGKGRKLTAQDIVYTFKRLIDPETASSGAWIFNDKIADKNAFTSLNDSTFVLKLKAPYAPILSILSMTYCAIVPKEAIDYFGKDFRNNPIGTGPFQFQLWDENNILLLKRNPNYWEKDTLGNTLPYLDGIKITFNETRIMEFLLFRQNSIDFINGIDGSVKDLILTKNGALKSEFKDQFNLTKQLYLNTEYLGFLVDTNLQILKNNPIAIKKIRQAINYAIDKKKIVTFYRNGIGQPADKGFVPKGLWANNNDTTINYGYDFRPDKAMVLLKEAGWKNKQTFGTILLYCPESNIDVCNFIASQLQDIGLDVQLSVAQPSILRQLMSKNEAPFFKAQWIADYPDPETYLSFFYGPYPSPPNYTRFNHTDFNKLYKKSIATIDNQTREYLYRQMDSLVMAEAPLVPLFYDEILHFTQNNIIDMRRNAMNIINLKYTKKR